MHSKVERAQSNARFVVVLRSVCHSFLKNWLSAARQSIAKFGGIALIPQNRQVGRSNIQLDLIGYSDFAQAEARMRRNQSGECAAALAKSCRVDHRRQALPRDLLNPQSSGEAVPRRGDFKRVREWLGD
jgi:hypothetical protein